MAVKVRVAKYKIDNRPSKSNRTSIDAEWYRVIFSGCQRDLIERKPKYHWLTAGNWAMSNMSEPQE